MESRQLLTGGLEDLGPDAATYLADFATQKLEAKLNSIFPSVATTWTAPLTSQLGTATTRLLNAPGYEHFDATVEPLISSVGGAVQGQMTSVSNTIQSSQLNLNFGTIFGYGNSVTTETYEGGGYTSGSEGSSGYTDYLGFWYTGQFDWLNPSPTAGVSVERIVANVNVGGMAPTFQGDITINRTLEFVNGDKNSYAVTMQYSGDNAWLYHGSATRKIGSLTLNAHANGNQDTFNEYGLSAQYFAGPLTFAASYNNDYGFDTFNASMTYKDVANGLFANATVEKDMMDNLIIAASLGKRWSETEWFAVGAGLVDFDDSAVQDYTTATLSYSLKSKYTFEQRVTAALGYTNGDYSGGLPDLSINGLPKSATGLELNVQQYHDSTLGALYLQLYGY